MGVGSHAHIIYNVVRLTYFAFLGNTHAASARYKQSWNVDTKEDVIRGLTATGVRTRHDREAENRTK